MQLHPYSYFTWAIICVGNVRNATNQLFDFSHVCVLDDIHTNLYNSQTSHTFHSQMESSG
jgi:hypothetical protein